MTLLVLSLDVPRITGEVTDAKLWQALTNIEVGIVDFVVSFLLLGNAWAVHMRQFEFIRSCDRRLTMINTLRLLTVVFIPFSTSMAGDYTGLILGKVLLPINFFVLGLIGSWQWHYACRHRKQFAPELTETEMRKGTQRNNAFIAISALVVALSVFVGIWAFLLFFAMPLVINLTNHKKQS